MISKYIKKGMYALMLSLLMVFVLSTGVVAHAEGETGWKKDSHGWYYVYSEGSYYSGETVRINGKLYCFDDEGYMVTGWIADSDGTSYRYADSNGVIKEDGWLLYKGEYYYFSWCYMQTGLREIDEIKYYFAEDGHMIKGWYKDSYGDYYLAYKNGHVVNGWYLENGKYYYINEYSRMVTGYYTINEKRYYFNQDGQLQTGWFKSQYDEDMYADKNGVLQTGWVKSGKDYYYIDGGVMRRSSWVDNDNYYVDYEGKMCKNKVVGYYNGKTTSYYYLGGDGKVVTSSGWRKIIPTNSYESVTWCYLKTGGVVANGWQKIGEKWFYFSGHSVVRGTFMNLDNQRYLFAADGSMVTGWYNRDTYGRTHGNWYYADSNGKLYDGWLRYGGKWYYFHSGEMQTGWISVYDSNANSYKYYYANEDGELVYGWYRYDYVDEYGQKKTSWYYTDPKTGECYTGWVKSGSEWYYISDGRMARDGSYLCVKYDEYDNYYGSIYANGPKIKDYVSKKAYTEAVAAYRKANMYVFDHEGRLTSGWYVNETGYAKYTYYAKPDGKAYDGWLKSGGKYYYIENGLMLTNRNTPDGYYVDSNGVCR